MKTYVKPDLYYEDFELSQHVATCAIDMPHSGDPTSCYGEIEYFDEKVFQNVSICEFTDFEDYCYTNGGNEFNLFNS